MRVFIVCDECAVAALNDDWTSDDLDVPRAQAFVESHAPLSLFLSEASPSNYWDCDSCSQTQIGFGVLLAENR